MEQWNFYLSGILYGVLENRNGRVYHRPLDVYTGRLDDWQELESGNNWYRELGKMDVREALLGLKDYEAGVRGCADGADDCMDGTASCTAGAASCTAGPSSCKRFITPRGEIFEKKEKDA